MKFSNSKIENKNEVIKNNESNDFVFSCEKMKLYIKRLKSGCNAW